MPKSCRGNPALAAALLTIEPPFTVFQGGQTLLAPPHNLGEVYADSQEWLSYQNAKRFHRGQFEGCRITTILRGPNENLSLWRDE